MKKKPTIAISPVSNDYLTKGKEYEIMNLGKSTVELGYIFDVISNNGVLITAIEHGSSHTKGLSWTLK